MKKLISFILLFLLSGTYTKIYAQKLVLQNNLNKDVKYELKRGKVMWIQTMDDPLDAATKCYFGSYDGVNLIVKLNPKDSASLRIPVNHIASLYFNKFDHKFFVRHTIILYAYINGTVIIAGGFEIYGLAIITGGLGLATFFKIVDQIGTKKRVYMPHYSQSLKHRK